MCLNSLYLPFPECLVRSPQATFTIGVTENSKFMRRLPESVILEKSEFLLVSFIDIDLVIVSVKIQSQFVYLYKRDYFVLTVLHYHKTL